MKKKVLSMLLLVTMAASLLPSSIPFVRVASATQLICVGTVGGVWSADDGWCEIDTVTELNNISNNSMTWEENYRLTGNIDLTSYNGKRIGDPFTPFTGKFDGNGFTLRNLTMNSTKNVGFFGGTEGATIEDVHLVNIDVTGYQYVGGLVGDAINTTIINSSAEGVVTGNDSVGVLVGYNEHSSIIDSYSHGEVIVGASPVDSYGGLVGYSTGTITGSYTTAKVGAGSAAGGLVGDNVYDDTDITNSYWNGDTSVINVSDGGTKSDTANMKLRSTYDAWDFTSASPTWGMIDKITYPLHFGDYKKVALNSLGIEDPDGDATIVWDRDFTGDNGVYELQVVNRTNALTISAESMESASSIAFFEDTDMSDANPPSTAIPDLDSDQVVTVSLAEGKNVFGVQVTGDNDREAMYLLTVIREDGSLDYPHRISTADELAQIGQASGYDLDDAYVQEADLDLSGLAWSPIGTAVSPFEGNFNGQSHTIHHLTINRTAQSDIGLFGSTNNATIANVSLLGVDVHGGIRVGSLIGNAAGTLTSSRIAVQGAVYGNTQVGGLIGSSTAVLNIDESYSAARVEGNSDTGGLIGRHTGTNTITDSFWDKDVSGQSSSPGGGADKSTTEMMTPLTYSSSNWPFAVGGWGIIEGTTYPMPYNSLQGALLSNVTVTIAGANIPLSFNRNKGSYSLALTAPVPEAKVTVVPNNAGATIAIDGQAGGTKDVDLDFGINNIIDIRTTGTDGWQGVYRLAISVPVPKPVAVDVPSNAKYGIGDELDFTVTYDYPVEVDTGNIPSLPITLDDGEKAALYIGQPSGQSEKLSFRYTVQESNEANGGIELGNALVASSPGSIVGVGDPAAASMQLPSSLPVTNGIVIDGIKPEIELTPSTTNPTKDSITVTVNAIGTGTNILELKLGNGNKDVSYFALSGTTVTGNEFVADDNGDYTVYAMDQAGNEQVKFIKITNILTTKPTILLDYQPRTPTRGAVEVSVTASVYDAAGGNGLQRLKWSAGALSTGDFADPTFGADVVAEAFSVSANGDYTVYAIDTAGNERTENIEITNIITTKPTIVLDYNPRTSTADAIEVSVTVSVYDAAAGNGLQRLKWAAGALSADDFANPAFGSDVVGGTFSVTANGDYTVYAIDSAGNEQIESISISNIESKPNQMNSPVLINPQWHQYLIDPKKDNVLTFEGLTLHIPAGAVDQPTFMTMEVVTDAALKLVQTNQQLLSKAYELKKYTAGNFKVPIKLSIEWDDAKIGDNQRAAIAYYDETAKHWVALKGKAEGSQITGETDHFTKFAVISVALEQPVLSDINGHWAEKAIQEGAAVGLVSGYSDGTFRPEQSVTRAEFVTMLHRLLEWSAGAKAIFVDDADILPWANESVSAAVNAGVVSGYPDQSFRPGARISRAEAAVMVSKADGLQVAKVTKTEFADDAAIAAWTKPYINAAQTAGLIQGQGGNKFNPLSNMTRAEAVVLLLRLAASFK
ncbi:S-layer homology domain-containing protein [Cohnella lupini]|nr:S-layer homology domain-containing protein [Cohnella lupini]